MKILFITANRVGDAVLTTGLLAWLVDRHPSARFTIACGPYGADLFRSVPRLAKLIVMKKKKWNIHWYEFWKQVVGTHWDLVIDLRNSAVSRVLSSRKTYRHARGSGNHKVMDNAAVLGLNPPPDPRIWLLPDAIAEASRLLPADRPILALGPAANWALKQWPVTNFIELIRDLTSPGGALEHAVILIIADTHERAQIAPLLMSVPDDSRIELIGGRLQIAAACLKRARLYIGNDSGLMHLSAALGTPTLGLFGPGYPNIYGPWGNKCAYVTTTETREELMAHLPDASDPEPTLMRTLSVARVAAAARELLRKTA